MTGELKKPLSIHIFFCMKISAETYPFLEDLYDRYKYDTGQVMFSDYEFPVDTKEDFIEYLLQNEEYKAMSYTYKYDNGFNSINIVFLKDKKHILFTLSRDISNSDEMYDDINALNLLDKKSLVVLYSRIFSKIENFGKNDVTEDLLIEKYFELAKQKFGFNIYWFFSIQSKESKEREICPSLTDEILLNAPVYKTQKLPSGIILMQLTEKRNPEGFDQDYYDAWLKLYDYLEKNIN